MYSQSELFDLINALASATDATGLPDTASIIELRAALYRELGGEATWRAISDARGLTD